MFTGQLVGIGFLVVGMVALSSYSDDLAIFHLPLFTKQLRPMQERWGKTTGTILHLIEYVVIPLGFAFFFLARLVF